MFSTFIVDFCLLFSPNPHFFSILTSQTAGLCFFQYESGDTKQFSNGSFSFFSLPLYTKERKIFKKWSLNLGSCSACELSSHWTMAPFGRDKLRHRKHLFPTIRDVLKNMEKFFLLFFFQLLNIGSSVFFAKHGIGEIKKILERKFLPSSQTEF